MTTTKSDFLYPTAATFDREVLAADGPVLVDFWAPWCGPCQAMKPVVESVAARRGLRTAFVNIDDDPELMHRFGIQSIPALKLFRDGVVVAETMGGRSTRALEQWLAENGA